MTKELEKYEEMTFEEIRHVDDDGNEYWYARELQQILGYKEWRYFSAVIEKAQVACSQSNNSINSHLLFLSIISRSYDIALICECCLLITINFLH